MNVSGFTFIKDAIIYDYPVVESIRSILPVCNEVIVAVGKSKDDTLNLIKSIDPQKVKIIETEWDETLRTGGKVLAQETNKAFKHISKDSDWAFYIQADEIIHEQYLTTIYEKMNSLKDSKNIDGLLFNYLHFYGSYDYVGASPRWYDKEIRIIRNNPEIYSYRDAQGFRIRNNEKLCVQPIDAYVYHYGWVKEPKAMQRKQEQFHKLWHDDQWVQSNIAHVEAFEYASHIDLLRLFEGSHPEVMRNRIQDKNWKFDFDISLDRRSFKARAKAVLKSNFGIDLGYRNYKICNPGFPK